MLFAVLHANPALPQANRDEDKLRCVGGSFGVPNNRAVEVPAPVYPDQAKGRGVTGTVLIFIVVDERGRVSKARACSGPRELRQPTEDAAYKARFSPTLLSGVPVKNRGALTYAFPPKEKSGDPGAAPNSGMHPPRDSLPESGRNADYRKDNVKRLKREALTTRCKLAGCAKSEGGRRFTPFLKKRVRPQCIAVVVF